MAEEATRRHVWSLRCFARPFASWSTVPARCYAVSTLPAWSYAIVRSCDASTVVLGEGEGAAAALVVVLRAVVQSAKNAVANVSGCPERECSATMSAWAGTNSAHRVSAPETERGPMWFPCEYADQSDCRGWQLGPRRQHRAGDHPNYRAFQCACLGRNAAASHEARERRGHAPLAAAIAWRPGHSLHRRPYTGRNNLE